MARWQPDARGRLERAALELYGERGFDQTTVAEIAARAGLTERTFFRHYADKREVLFGGSDAFIEVVAGATAAAPAAVPPLEAIVAGLEAAGALLDERRELARLRAPVIAANPELRERELAKLASWAAALADALRARGVGEPAATISADVGMALFRNAFARWLDDANRRALPALIRDAFGELQGLAAPGVSRRPASAAPRRSG